MKLVELSPASRASRRLAVGSTVLTLFSASDTQGSGPCCPSCGQIMRPLPDHEDATLVRCEEQSCPWFCAPFRSAVAATRPPKRAAEEVLDDA